MHPALTHAAFPRRQRRVAQAARTVSSARRCLMASLLPPPPAGFWRWAVCQMLPAVLVGMLMATVGAMLLAVGSG